MSIRVRGLDLRAATEQGPYGLRLSFEDGLTLLRGDNNAGKSTCLKAILYGLGLEGMLGPGQGHFLPDSMTKRLQTSDGWLPVLEGRIRVEIENEKHEFITAERTTTGTTKDRQLVTVLEGKALSHASGALEQHDYYVRTAGAAQDEFGFHHRLAQFMGLELPEVPRFDGSPGPLYLECLFSLFFVEQVTGWRGLQARMPTYFSITVSSQVSLKG